MLFYEFCTEMVQNAVGIRDVHEWEIQSGIRDPKTSPSCVENTQSSDIFSRIKAMFYVCKQQN